MEPELPRKLKLFSLTNIVIGDMIGAGIFTTSGLLLAQLHDPLLLIFTAIHYFGLKSGSRVQNILTAIKIVLITALVFCGFAFGEGSMDHFIINQEAGGRPANLKGIGLSLMWIMFAYSGWNASTYVGSEILDPRKNIPRSLLLGTGLVTLLYLLLNLVRRNSE